MTENINIGSMMEWVWIWYDENKSLEQACTTQKAWRAKLST